MRNIFAIITTIFILALFGCMHTDSNSKKMNDVTKKDKIYNMKETPTTSESVKKRCNIDIVLEVDENIDSLSENMIYLFLYSFDKVCSSNVEFSEYSNEILFKLLKYYPEQVAKNIVKDSINQDVILKELSSPINDAINTDEVIKAVENANINGKTKERFISALKGKYK